MKKLFKVLSAFVLILLLFNAFYACKTDELPNPEVPTFCDSIAANYTDTVKAILDAKCSVGGCHLNSQAPNLNDFTQVSGSATRIAVRALDAQTMPPLGMPALTDREKEILNCWRNAGFPEN